MKTIYLSVLLVALSASAEPKTLRVMPDPELTPGVVRELSKAKVCSTKWGKDRRHVTAAMKREVFSRYGCEGNDASCCGTDRHGRHCEIDHLISRELGGADSIENLWPEPYVGRWGAVAKDRLENRLHREICEGRLGLKRAQNMIRDDWRDTYRIYFGEPK